MYDGMVLSSMASYPLEIQQNPFRVNNVTILLSDLHFKNGVVHNALNYPHPLVSWIGKSMLDILLEINDLRKGDLSVFIGLIEMMSDLKLELKGGENVMKGITLFVPTNAAIALSHLNLTKQEGQPSELDLMIQELILNHVVTGNFARSCWWATTTGTVISHSKLQLKSQAGQLLNLTITDFVIINEVVNITHEDIFSEDGIIQIIDHLITL
jgi:Fasciclin domain